MKYNSVNQWRLRCGLGMPSRFRLLSTLAYTPTNPEDHNSQNQITTKPGQDGTRGRADIFARLMQHKGGLSDVAGLGSIPMGTKNPPAADAAGWVLPDDDERSGTLETVHLEVVVEGENLREAQALGSRHQRGVGEVHRSVLILFHQYR